jgi:1-acyl-sn-glycerol-3-phosphate acyltransferase
MRAETLRGLARALWIVPLLLLNTLLHTSVLFGFAVLKLLLPFAATRRRLSRALTVIAENWIAVNSWMLEHFSPTVVRVEGGESLRYAGWYLVVSNHQSWVDIVVLQKVFNRRIPFLKFFLKKELIWVPVLGLAWWALDFPFMRRYTPEQLRQRPELKGADVGETRKACERFRAIPVSVMNFVEGTRFTPTKHARHAEAFRHLLRPKAGGIAFVMNAMGEILQSVVDVSIVYPDGIPTLFDLIAGRVSEVRVRIRERAIPADLISGDYENDGEFRTRFQAWINEIWRDKDSELESMRR